MVGNSSDHLRHCSTVVNVPREVFALKKMILCKNKMMMAKVYYGERLVERLHTIYGNRIDLTFYDFIKKITDQSDTIDSVCMEFNRVYDGDEMVDCIIRYLTELGMPQSRTWTWTWTWTQTRTRTQTPSIRTPKPQSLKLPDHLKSIIFNSSNKECPICLDRLDTCAQSEISICGHIYCRTCFDDNRTFESGKCAICRSDMFTHSSSA